MPPPVSVIAWGKLTIPAPRLIIETDRPPAEEVIGAFTPIAPLPPVRERPPPATLVIVTSEVVALPIRPGFRVAARAGRVFWLGLLFPCENRGGRDPRGSGRFPGEFPRGKNPPRT